MDDNDYMPEFSSESSDEDDVDLAEAITKVINDSFKEVSDTNNDRIESPNHSDLDESDVEPAVSDLENFDGEVMNRDRNDSGDETPVTGIQEVAGPPSK